MSSASRAPRRGDEGRTPLLLKVGIIILLVMIIPTVSLTAFLSQQTRKLAVSRTWDRVIAGWQVLQTSFDYKVQQLEATAVRVRADLQGSNFGAGPASPVLPFELAPQIDIRIYDSSLNPVFERTANPLGIMSPLAEELMAAAIAPRERVLIRSQGIALQYLVPFRTDLAGGLLLLQSDLSTEGFDVAQLASRQDTSIYRVNRTTLQNLRREEGLRAAREADTGTVQQQNDRRPTQNQPASTELVRAEILFTTRYDQYGRRVERGEIAIPLWAVTDRENRNGEPLQYFETVEGIDMISTYRPLPIGEDGEYIGHVSMPVRSEVAGEDASYLWIIVTSVLVLILVMSVLISRFIVRPIVDLVAAVDSLRRNLRERGPLDPIAVPTDDEIGELAEAFNLLAAELRYSFDQIRSQREEILNYTATLEQRVTERTRELEDARVRAEIANVHKSRFLVNMNHELRTPLNSISGVTDLLRLGAYERTDDIIKEIETWCSEQRRLHPGQNKRFLDKLETFAGHLVLSGDGISAFMSYITDIEEHPEEFKEFRAQVEALLKDEQRSIYKAYATIREAGEILLNIIDEVIHLSRIESGVIELQKSPRKLSELVNYAMVHSETFAMNRGKSGKIRLECDVADDVPQNVVVDGQKIKQVLLNFMTNAIKYTREGSVKLTVGRGSEPGTICFSVTDTGMGIAEKDRAVIFTEFGRAFSVRDIEGTGLGLALSKRLVVAHGGQIGFETEEDRGSRFWFTIPAVFD